MKLLSLLCIAAELAALLPSVALAQSPRFSDIEFSWYQQEIEDLASTNAITGYEDGTFKPRTVINRAEFLTLLMRSQAEVEPVAGGRRCFPDVNPDEWYAKWACAASRRKIVGGYPDGNFRGEQPVNIAEAHAMMLRLLNVEVNEQPGEKWYEPYSDFLHKQEIVSKYSYIPWDPLTRERAADLIYKLSTYKDNNRSSRMSPGCGKPEPSHVPTNVVVHDQERTFILDVPRNYQNRTPTPLVVAFHGRTNSAEQVRSYYGFTKEFSDYLVVYPQALANGNGNGFTYANNGDKPQELRDIAFFDEMVHTIANQYCVDMFQIYAAGHSLGGWFANTIGCVRGDVVRATASVGSSSTITHCTGPTAGLFIHNPKDNLAPVSTGITARDHRMETNMCSGDFTPVEPHSLNCERISCLEGHPVEWCPHNEDTDYRGAYYPHTWPGGAEQAMRQFFEGLPE